MFAATAAFGAAALLSDDASYIRIATENRDVRAGEFFSIDIFAGAHVPVNAVDIAVRFPEEQITIEGIDTGGSVITIWTEDPEANAGVITFSGGTFRKGFVGEHLIGTINARARETGVAKFTLEDTRLLAGDGRGSTVSIDETEYESLTMYVDVGSGDTSADGTLGGTVQIRIYTDIDGNGTVDMNDVWAFMSAWRSDSVTYDFNADGRMTFVDFAIILADSFFK